MREFALVMHGFDKPHAPLLLRRLLKYTHALRSLVMFKRVSTSKIRCALTEGEDLKTITPARRRVLHLNGTWSKPRSEFQLIARIEIGAGGAARGVIHWQGLGHEHRLCGDEVVEGFLSERSLDVEGLEIGPGLARDHYRVTLATGKLTGSFTGASKAFGDWSGRMTGTYLFEDVT